jgi:hypothetical protein
VGEVTPISDDRLVGSRQSYNVVAPLWKFRSCGRIEKVVHCVLNANTSRKPALVLLLLLFVLVLKTDCTSQSPYYCGDDGFRFG